MSVNVDQLATSLTGSLFHRVGPNPSFSFTFSCVVFEIVLIFFSVFFSSSDLLSVSRSPLSINYKDENDKRCRRHACINPLHTSNENKKKIQSKKKRETDLFRKKENVEEQRIVKWVKGTAYAASYHPMRFSSTLLEYYRYDSILLPSRGQRDLCFRLFDTGDAQSKSDFLLIETNFERWHCEGKM